MTRGRFWKVSTEMVMEKVRDYHYPVCFDFPVGHVKENYALKCGVNHKLHVSERGTILHCISEASPLPIIIGTLKERTCFEKNY